MFSFSQHSGRFNPSPTQALPAVTRRPGAFILSLLVLACSISTMPAQAANKKPKLTISKVAPVNEGSPVTLTGTATDSDGQVAIYQWTQTKGSPTVSLTNANAASASFTAPTLPRLTKKTKAASLTFKLKAVDNGNPPQEVSKTVVVKINPIIKTPAANAGSDKTVGLSKLVTLDGSASNDSQDGGQIVKWQWKQLTAGVPKAARVRLSNAKSATASFTSPAIAPTTPLQFELKVTDNDGKTHTDTVSITVSSVQPQPLAATFDVSKSTPTAGEEITASTTPSGGAAPYTVTFDWGDGSTPSTGSNSATHTYATAGTYTLTTTVKDSASPQDTKTNTASITVSEPVQPLSGALSLVAAQVEFNNPIQAVVNNIAGGTKPYTVKISWGDGKPDSTATLSGSINGVNDEHFYELVGNYTITVTITDANNLTKQYTTSATVTEVQAPLADCN